MFKWTPYPFLRICPIFIAGIMAYLYFPAPLFPMLCLFVVIAVLYAVLVFLVTKGNFYKVNSIFGFLGLLAIFLSGYIITYQYQDENNSAHLLYQGEGDYYTVTVVKGGEEKANTYEAEAEVNFIKSGKIWQKAMGKILLYQSKEDGGRVFNYGDRLLVKGSPQVVQGPNNPGEFNYKIYLQNQNIYHTHFIADQEYVLYDSINNSFLALSYQLRRDCKTLLKRYIDGTAEEQIALALVLGVRDKMDNEIRQAYAAAGVMHVLAVSGLHIAILYGVVLWIFGWLKRFKGGKWMLLCISLSILWGYAFLTGLPASVFRAVTMFTFIIIAQTVKRQTNIYNTLAASAFVLLCVNPMLIKSVGFQLSYLAVVGIVYLQPKLYRLVEFEHYWQDKLWAFCMVSVAAQLSVFPLGIYYFHQFPNYFLLTNLLVIPASFVILCGGLAIIVLGAVPVLASLIGKCLEVLIAAVNAFVVFVGNLPFSYSSGLYFTATQTVLIYGIIISLLMLLAWRKFKFIVIAFSLLFVFSVIKIYRIYGHNTQQQITFYQTNQSNYIALNEGRKSMFLNNPKMKGSDFGYHITPNRLQKGLNDRNKTLMDVAKVNWQNLKVLVWKGKSYVFVEAAFNKSQGFKSSLPVDYVVIQNNAIKDLEEINKRFHYQLLIWDSSNKRWQLDRIMKQADSLGTTYYSVPHQGAFVIN